MKICRIFAYIRRFINNCRNKFQWQALPSQLSASEIDHAFLNIVSMIQQEHYSAEIKLLSKNKPISSTNSLSNLNPFLEKVNQFVLLKVGGRLVHANLPYEAKCPIILPKANMFVNCYVRHLHLTNMHAGAQALVCAIRKRFWIIGAREYARKIVRKCVHCVRYKPKLLSQIMGQLPKDRVNPVKPFTYSGVDFCGPIITTWRQRGRPKYKTYIAVFVCFVKRAVHLEVVSNLSAEEFIAALKRFVAQQQFWTRWSKEYLVILQQRQKWDKQMPNIEPGVLVMIHEDNLPPQKWLIGRVSKVFKGADGNVRVAEIKTPSGLLKRSIVKLALLPMEEK